MMYLVGTMDDRIIQKNGKAARSADTHSRAVVSACPADQRFRRVERLGAFTFASISMLRLISLVRGTAPDRCLHAPNVSYLFRSILTLDHC
jgi:hypothetical protein